MNYSLYKTADNAESTLDSSISASDLTIVLNDASSFPATINGSATSGGDATTLNCTGIQALGVAVGDFIENLTDGSHAFILSVSTNSVTTTTLQGGSGNTWDSSDSWVVGQFIGTLSKRNATTGAITTSEKVKVQQRSSNTLTVATGGRGFDGSTAQAFDAGDYFSLFVVSQGIEDIIKGIAEQATDIKGLQDTAPSALEKIALARLLDFNITYSGASLDVTVAAGVYDNSGSSSSSTPLTLTGSSTNYIEVNQSTGVVSANTSAFNPSTSLALYTVTTDGLGVTAVSDERQVYGDFPRGSTVPASLAQGLTASGDITQGDPVGIASSGTVSAFVPELGYDSYYLYENMPGGNYNVRYHEVVALSETLFVVTAVNSSNYTVLYAVSLNKASGEYTFGSAQVIESNTSTKIGDLKKLSSTRGFLSYNAGATSYPTVVAFSVNASTLAISLGTAQTVNSTAASAETYRTIAYDLLDTDKLLLVYKHGSGVYTRVASVSSTSITLNSEVQLTSNVNINYTVGCAQLDTDKCLVMYYDGTNTVGRAVTVTSTTVDALPTAYTLLSSATQDKYVLRSPFAYTGETDIACIAAATGTTTITVWQYTVSGTTITADTTGDAITVSTMSNVATGVRGKFFMPKSTGIVFVAGYSSGSKRMYQLKYDGTDWVLADSGLLVSDYLNGSMYPSYTEGFDFISSGDAILYCITINSGYYRDGNFLRITAGGTPYGVADETAVDAASIDVITHGKVTLTDSYTAGDVIYTSFCGAVSTAYNQAIRLGIMRSTNDMNVNI